RALRLPSLAQNMTIDDFTTTAVGMRGCSLRSVTGATTAAERSKIFSDHATRRRSTVTVFAPSIASIPVRRLLPTGVVSVDSPQRPGESVAATPVAHRSDGACHHGSEPDTATDGVSPVAQWQVDLPHLLARSDRVPRRNQRPETNCVIRERTPRSAEEMAARAKTSLIA